MADRSIVCGGCGQANAASNNYCGHCGAFLKPAAGPGDATWRPSDGAGEPRLRRQATFIFAIAIFFALSCATLSAVVIIWHP